MPRLPALSAANLASSAALSRNRTTARTAAYWATTTLVAAEMGLGGMWDVLRTPQVRGVIDRLGYPTCFLVVLRVWKLLGAVALLAPRRPRLKEWAYAGAVFNYTGAVASNLAAGVGVAGDGVDAGAGVALQRRYGGVTGAGEEGGGVGAVLGFVGQGRVP